MRAQVGKHSNVKQWSWNNIAPLEKDGQDFNSQKPLSLTKVGRARPEELDTSL